MTRHVIRLELNERDGTWWAVWHEGNFLRVNLHKSVKSFPNDKNAAIDELIKKLEELKEGKEDGKKLQ